MSYAHYWEWTPPIPNPDQFIAWSRDVQRLLDYLPQYVEAGRKQLTLIGAKIDDLMIHGPITASLEQCEEYDERRHGNKDQYVLVVHGEGGTNPIRITGEDGTGMPIITDSLVAFNGDANEEESFAPFRVSKEILLNGDPYSDNKGFGACKTQGLPYDLLVTAALIRLAHYFPTVHISSDGGRLGMWEGSILCAFLKDA